MITNIPQRLTELVGNFVECVALEEVQCQSITLVIRKAIEKFLDGRLFDQTKVVSLCIFRTWSEYFRCSVEIDACVEVA